MKEKKKKFVVLLIVVFCLVLPMIIVARSAFIIRQTAPEFDLQKNTGSFSEEGIVQASEIFANKAKFAGKTLVARGKVSGEQVVCAKKDCPVGDSCCGCPLDKNLSLDGVRLMLKDKRAICQRIAGSCDYDCGDWELESYYDVSGWFVYVQPPPGWKLSTENYLQVESKTHLPGYRPASAAGSWWQPIKDNFQKIINTFRTSGYFIK